MFKRLLLTISVTLSLLSVDAAAGIVAPPVGTITYAPYTPTPTNPIPTMSEAMLIGMALLLAAVVFRTLRNLPGGRPLASLIAGSLAWMAVTGSNWIKGADADITDLPLTVQTGGTVDVPACGTWSVSNQTPVPQKITELNAATGSSFATPDTGTPCRPGETVLPPNPAMLCTVKVSCPPPPP